MNEDVFRAVLHFAVQQARLITNDQEALEVKCLYKEWEVQIGRELTVGEYVQYNGQLFRVLQTHVAQSEWKPGIGTESLYVVIDKEHAGTIEDPIPAKINMEYFNGKYYIEDEILYLCIRDSGIALQFMPSQLVGNYFEIVNEEIENEGTENEEIENEGTENEDKVEEEIIVEEGTLENPIVIEDYVVGINYEVNKYYLVNEEVYLCIRDGLLYHDPATLIGIYFEKVN